MDTLPVMVNWYDTLYSSSDTKTLHFDYKINSINNLIICKQKDEGRMFSLMDDPEVLNSIMEQSNPSQKCFYEIILGKRKRKPYFDIDIDLTRFKVTELQCDDYIEAFVNSIYDCVSEVCIPKTIVFTSHRESKLSYHIVVSNICLKSNEDSKTFTNMVITEDIKPFIDTKVYSNVQQFRVLGSHKYGKNNIKKINFSLSDNFYIPKNIAKCKKQQILYSLKMSLISYTKGCVLFKTPSQKKHKVIKTVMMDTNGYEVDEALAELEKIYGNFTSKQVRQINNSLIIELISKTPYYCHIHKRQHDHENAYILIDGNFSFMKNVWFNCRRIEPHEKNLKPLFVCHLVDPCKNKTKKIYKGFNVNENEN